MILIESQGPVPPIKIKYMNEEGIKVSARPILVLTYMFVKLFSYKACVRKSFNCPKLKLLSFFKQRT